LNFFFHSSSASYRASTPYRWEKKKKLEKGPPSGPKGEKMKKLYTCEIVTNGCALTGYDQEIFASSSDEAREEYMIWLAECELVEELDSHHPGWEVWEHWAPQKKSVRPPPFSDGFWKKT